MLEQEVTDSREVFNCDIYHCLEVHSRFLIGLKINTDICLVDHELVLWRGENARGVLALSNEVFGHGDELLFLERSYF